MGWTGWPGVCVAVFVGVVEAALTLLGRVFVDRPAVTLLEPDQAPVVALPEKGDRVAYGPDPALFGLMLHLGDDAAYEGRVLCEIDPTAQAGDDYQQRIESFAPDEIVHAASVWKPTQESNMRLGHRVSPI